jgi:hypothetical protein
VSGTFLGRFSQLMEELSTSVVVVNKKLRRLSTVGSHDLLANRHFDHFEVPVLFFGAAGRNYEA